MPRIVPPPKTGDPVCLQASPRRPPSRAEVSLEITVQCANDMTDARHPLIVSVPLISSRAHPNSSSSRLVLDKNALCSRISFPFPRAWIKFVCRLHTTGV